MKKIVFFDLDGTLLTSKREILKENIDAIKKIRENGVEVCLCSGRQQEVMKKYQEISGAGRYLICTNGAEIFDTEAKEELYSAPLEEDVCIKLFEYAMETINNDLMDSGYDTLYLGNPYDWLFIFSSKSEDPLFTFRCIYEEAVKESNQKKKEIAEAKKKKGSSNFSGVHKV